MSSAFPHTLSGVLAAALLFTALPGHAQDARRDCAKTFDEDLVRALPADLEAAAAKAFPGALPGSSVYRCMGGAVWLCNHGANLTCAKADQRREPPGVDAYCKQNPDQAFVPMAVTGHGTIHSFACVRGKPRITASMKVDRRGFIADQWTRIGD